jgi:uncharacterized damage-inducible protein DinB
MEEIRTGKRKGCGILTWGEQMEMMLYYRRLFEYDAWANRETLASMKAAANVPAKSLARIGHIIGTEYLYLARLKKTKAVAEVWSKLALADCDLHMVALQRDWSDYLHHLTEEDLTETIHYVNSKGEAWTNTVEDMLTQAAMHSAYHRGQIASDLRAAGFEPAYTDFIHAVRTHHVI